jgi:hypothetical protein
MKRLLASALVVLALLTSACARDDQQDSARTTTTEPEPEKPTEREQDPTTTTAPEPADAAFGQPFTWNDGLQITVSPPEEFRPDGAPPADIGPTYVKVVVRVLNGSETPYQPLLSFRVLRPGAKSPTIFLTDARTAGFPESNIAPGDDLAFTIGFEVTNPTGLVLEVAPGVAYPPATFAA